MEIKKTLQKPLYEKIPDSFFVPKEPNGSEFIQYTPKDTYLHHGHDYTVLQKSNGRDEFVRFATPEEEAACNMIVPRMVAEREQISALYSSDEKRDTLSFYAGIITGLAIAVILLC